MVKKRPTRQRKSKRVYVRAYASVRFFGESLDPIDVTKALKLPPDHTHRNGEPRFLRSQSGIVQKYPPYHDGSWSMSSEKWVNSPRLAVHLEWLLKQLEPRREEVAELLQTGVHADFFCFSSGTAETPPSLPRAIRERARTLGLPIQIDHYDAVKGL